MRCPSTDTVNVHAIPEERRPAAPPQGASKGQCQQPTGATEKLGERQVRGVTKVVATTTSVQSGQRCT